MKRLIKWLIPPDTWKRTVIVLAGVFFGLAAYAFYISKAPSYLSDSPQTCINCHVMNPQFANWAHSAHYRVAHCNDCHVPHDNMVNKYIFKAKDGLRHATIFTLRTEPQTIYIKEEGKEAVHSNCIRCHEKLLSSSYVHSVVPDYRNTKTERRCIECHRETPHGRVNGLASVPNAIFTQADSPLIPRWLKSQLNIK